MITRDSLIAALKRMGLKEGDIVLIHSDLRGFGLPENCNSREKILRFYYDSIRAVIGSSGTIAVPAYFYEYARYGVPFDVDCSPVSAPLGSFSQWLTHQPGRVRSRNPLQSIAALGQRSEELCGGTSLNGYGVTSPWHRLRLMGGKILFLGAPLQSMTYVHYIEQAFGVPHLYFKIFPYPVIKDKKQLANQPISAVRYLDYSIEYHLAEFERQLRNHGVLHTQKINHVSLHLVDAESAYEVGIQGLSQNPYFFLRHPPHFVAGKIPTDGMTATAHKVEAKGG